MIKIFSLFFLCFFSWSLSAQIRWFLSDEESSHKWAVVPSYKRDTSLGHTGGLRFFIYPAKEKGHYLALQPTSQQRPDYSISLQPHWMYWADNEKEWDVKLQAGRFYHPYYEDSSLKRIESLSQVLNFRSLFLSPFRGNLKAGGLLELLSRRELESPCFLIQQGESARPDKTKLKKPCRLFSKEEGIMALGAAFRLDTRDRLFSPRRGSFYQGELKAGYDFENKGPFFVQGLIKLQRILSFVEDEKWIFSFLAGGSLWNKKNGVFEALPYSAQFKLGGLELLKGYQQGRFHTSAFYLFQSQLRWPLSKRVQPLISLDLGRMIEEEKMRFTYGLGLTLSVSRSYDKKIRIEMAWALDQKNFIVAFDKPY